MNFIREVTKAIKRRDVLVVAGAYVMQVDWRLNHINMTFGDIGGLEKYKMKLAATFMPNIGAYWWMRNCAIIVDYETFKSRIWTNLYVKVFPGSNIWRFSYEGDDFHEEYTSLDENAPLYDQLIRLLR